MEGEFGVFRGVGRCGGVLGGPRWPSRGFPCNRTSKSHVQEILQEAVGDLQEDVQEEAESCFRGFKGRKMVGKGS